MADDVVILKLPAAGSEYALPDPPPLVDSDFGGGTNKAASNPNDLTSVPAWAKAAGAITSGAIGAASDAAQGKSIDLSGVPVLGTVQSLFDAKTWEGAALYVGGFVLMTALLGFGVYSLAKV